jgi:mono/diheme cytochrome c family protein
MPSYASSLKNDEAWDLARYILSMKGPAEPAPAEPIAHAKRIIEEKQCTACHVIEGKGGTVGPSLDVSAKKLRFEWMKEWLKNPRAFGKIYPFTAYRMPDLKLGDAEIESLLKYLAKLAGRTWPEAPEPPAAIDDAKASEGTLFYVVKCAECHNLGSVIPTPEAKRQGPDLIEVSRRLRYDWIPEWVKNPQNVYPGTAMVDTNLSEHEIDIVRAFLWKTSRNALSKAER